MPVATIGDLELDYDVRGTGEPLLLIMGIGASGALWDDELVDGFVARGFQVATFDHRDIGRSSRLDHLPVPSPRTSLVRGMVGLPVAAPYTLSDLARDTVGLLDHLGWECAHVLGVSMGGMVAQHLALEHPERLLSLTSLSSTPGSRWYPPAPRALRAMFAPRPRTPEQAIDNIVALFTVIGSPGYPAELDRVRMLAGRAVERGLSPRGYLRHFAAILASGDRTRALRKVTTPTLVVHGELDPLIRIGAGRATARAIPDAWWLPIAGMGHDIPRAVWPRLIDAVVLRARSGRESIRRAS
jgi:pimeloyl-ACP methyl ester carboxylesterase